ncbi:hypothetical protein BsWGS_27894 [Bradybaena similaris]
MTKDGDFGQEERNFLATSSDGTVLLGIPLVSAIDVGSPGTEGVSGIKMEDDEDLDGVGKNDVDEDVDVTQMLSVVNTGGNLIRANHTTLESLLSTPVSGSQVFAQSDGIQVITLPTTSELISIGGAVAERLLHVVPAGTDLSSLATKCIGFIAIANPGVLSQGKTEITGFSGLEMVQTADISDLNSAAAENMAAILMPPPPPPPPDLPINCPPWAMRLRKCEKIGDSYRGYVETEIDLDMILTLHKQQTNSFWGTRQSPSPAKASTRLMWKSQYVPFDGIPFVNAGSRAVVMECQFGPRRKGTLGKRGATSNTSNEFKQTCPARIYIKKVRKFPSYAVNLNMDKKSIRLAMDKAFHELREQGLDSWGEERYYVQLPTEKAHDYHEECSNSRMEASTSGLEEPPLGGHPQVLSDDKSCESRIHPVVLEKIRRLVASGETKLYSIRRQLRRFVIRDLFQVTGHLPERHDLTMFPTVNDLKNHIHQALKDIESGLLPYAPQVVNLEVIQSQDGSNSEERDNSREEKPDMASIWSGANISSGAPMPETVTVTLTQNPGEDGHHIISRIETHLSDGTTQVSATLTPETAQLLSRLHPTLFSAGSILRLEGTGDEHSESKTVKNHLAVLEVSEGTELADHPASSQNSPMEEGVHAMGDMDSGHLSSIVDIDSSHNISEMIDSSHNISEMIDSSHNISEMIDSSHNISEMIDSDMTASILVSSEHSHSMSTMHLHHNASQHIPGLIDTDSANLASIVRTDGQHHIAGLIIPGAGLSVLGGVGPDGLSDMVAVGHSDAITLVSDDTDHTMDLVSGDGVGANLHLVGDVCEQMLPKSHLDDHEDSHEKLSEDKLILHISPDEQIGMTRLENRVSDL